MKNTNILALLAAALLVFTAESAGETVNADSTNTSVSGTVRFNGPSPMRDTPDNEGRRRPILQVNREDEGIAYAVIYLKSELPEPPASQSDMTEAVRIDQVDYEFVPGVVALRNGAKISVGNSDTANHNVRTVTKNPANAFNTMTPYDRRYEHVIQAEPSEAPIRLACDIHPWMTGWIYVFDHDRYAVTDKSGQFEIHRVPPGKYLLVAIQPDGGLRAEGNIDAREGTSLVLDITFGEKNLRRQEPGIVRVSSR